MRLTILFIVCFIAGSAVGLIARASLHKPYEDAPAADGTSGEPAHGHADHGAMTPPAPPHADHAPRSSAPDAVLPPGDQHAGHASTPAATKPTVEPASATATVNTICPVCGMEVDPELPTVDYQGKKIGIGCAMCLPKIRRELDRYGSAALEDRKEP